MPFPTAFPAAAFSTIGNALVTRQFSIELLEPAYDVQGYCEYRILGLLPAPQPPAPVQPEKLFAAPVRPLSHDEAQHVGRMMIAAAEDEGRSIPEGVQASPGAYGALPWLTIFKVVAALVQGLLAADQDPYPPHQPAAQ